MFKQRIDNKGVLVIETDQTDFKQVYNGFEGYLKSHLPTMRSMDFSGDIFFVVKRELIQDEEQKEQLNSLLEAINHRLTNNKCLTANGVQMVCSLKFKSSEDRCSSCGERFNQSDLINYKGRNVCAQCKQQFFQGVQEGASLQGAKPYKHVYKLNPDNPLLNPWVSILFKPHETMVQILATDKYKHIHLIIVLTGIVVGIGSFDPIEMGDGLLLENFLIMGLVIVLMPVFYLLYLYLASWFSLHIGKTLFNGRGDFADVRAAVVWPSVLSLWFFIFNLLLIAIGLYAVISGVGFMIVMFKALTGLLSLIYLIYYCVISSFTMGVAHRISGMAGFATVFLTGIVLGIIGLLIGCIFMVPFMIFVGMRF